MKQQVTFWFFPAPAVNMTGYPVAEPSLCGATTMTRVSTCTTGPTLRLTRCGSTASVTNRANDSTFDARMTFSAVAVPEPGAAAAAFAAAAGLLLSRRRCAA